jgi:hypothetical protein
LIEKSDVIAKIGGRADLRNAGCSYHECEQKCISSLAKH